MEYLISDLKGKKITGTFYKKELDSITGLRKKTYLK